MRRAPQYLIVPIAVAALQFAPIAGATDNVALHNYSCTEFLGDTKQPQDGNRLAKSLMMIAWAAGYAAAFQKDAPRADATAIQLIAAALGEACRNAPTKPVVGVVADMITKFATDPSAGFAPAGHPTPPVASTEMPFDTYDNYDIYGGDVQKIQQVNLADCVVACQSEARCKAYSYDKWSRVCFLKDRLTTLSLEPNSISGVKGATQLERSRAKVSIERRSNRAFAGKVYSKKISSDFDSCQRLCGNESQCVSFSFVTAAKQCQLYSSVDNHRAQQGVDSGIKRQSP